MSQSLIKKCHQVLLAMESGSLVFLFLLMIIISVVQIVMRNFMGGGLLWAESLLRIIVLWLALLGAMVASRGDQHISIDVIVNKLPEKLRKTALQISRASTALICFIVAWYSLLFVLDDYQFGGIAFANVPSWLCVVIIPFALFVIAIRYSIAAIVKNQTETMKQ